MPAVTGHVKQALFDGALLYLPGPHSAQTASAVVLQAVVWPEPAGHTLHASQGPLPPADHVLVETQLAQAPVLAVALQGELAPLPAVQRVHGVQGGRPVALL